MASRIVSFLILSVFLCFVGPPSSVAQPSGSDLDYKIWFEPKHPVLGSSYKMYIQVWNNDPRFAQRVRVTVYKVPEKDRLMSTPNQQQHVGPRGSHTFVFEIYCGQETGNITWDVVPEWVD